MCPWLPAHESENVRQVYPNKSQNLPQKNVKIQKDGDGEEEGCEGNALVKKVEEGINRGNKSTPNWQNIVGPRDVALNN